MSLVVLELDPQGCCHSLWPMHSLGKGKGPFHTLQRDPRFPKEPFQGLLMLLLTVYHMP